MKQKHIGYFFYSFSTILTIYLFILLTNLSEITNEYFSDKGSCFLESGRCLHGSLQGLTIAGISIIISLYLFSTYLAFFDKKGLGKEKSYEKISESLKAAKNAEKSKDEFKAFLAGFNDEEKKVLQIIHDNEGILQSTLKFKADMSKSSLSIMIKDFQSRNIVKRKPHKKSYELYLVKKY